MHMIYIGIFGVCTCKKAGEFYSTKFGVNNVEGTSHMMKIGYPIYKLYVT